VEPEGVLDSTHTLNAYKCFSDELEADDPYNPYYSRNFFSSADPGVNTRRYDLHFYGAGGVFFNFKYAVSASWMAPSESATPPYTADDFPVSANMPEACHVWLHNTGSTAYYESPSSYGGDLDFELNIRDWQLYGWAANLHEQVESVSLESPTLFPDIIELDLQDAHGYFADPTRVVVPVSIEDVTPTSVANQLIMVTVKSANPSTYQPQIPGISGYDYPDGPLAAYAVLEAPQGPAPLLVNLDPELSYDVDGEIALYEWDFEGDGTYDYVSPALEVIQHSYQEGAYLTVLRVTDDNVPPATDTDELTINAWPPGITGWRHFRQNLRRTGRTDTEGPVTDNVEFTFDSGASIFSGIVVDGQQRAIFRANNGYAYCVNSSGSLAWSYEIGGTYDYGSPCVAEDDSVYLPTSLGYLYHLNSDGSLDWSRNYPYDAIDAVGLQNDGTIIFTTLGGYVVKVDSSGGEIWAYQSGNKIPGAPCIADDGTIYVTNHSGEVHAVNQSGGQVWVTDCGDDEMSAAPALGPLGIYVSDWGGTTHCLDYSGDIAWSQWLSDESISSVAAVGLDGNVYIGSRDDHVHCLDQVTGDVKWSYLAHGDLGTMSPVLDGDSHIYFGDYGGWFQCITTDGDLVWEHQCVTGTTYMYCKSPAIAEDGTVFVGSNAGILFAFKDE
jgi:outer membrane protein assembly factor BamB